MDYKHWLEVAKKNNNQKMASIGPDLKKKKDTKQRLEVVWAWGRTENGQKWSGGGHNTAKKNDKI